MDGSGIALILVLVVLAIIVIPLIWGVSTYNGFVRLRNLVQESWRQIDVELHRRYDLIPNLIETVKGFAAHERAVFEAVTNARAMAANPGSTPAEQAAQEDALSSALTRLFAVAENYPQLRSVESFVALQNELTNTEDRIAAGRRFYNANVRELNTKVETFPASIIAGLFKFTRAEYFESTDPAVRAVPAVSFQDRSGNVGQYGTPPPSFPHPTDAPGPGYGGQPGGFQPGQGGGQPGYPQSPPPMQ